MRRVTFDGRRQCPTISRLLLFAGVVALLPLVRLLRGDGKATPSRPVSGPRLLVEAFVTALAVIGAVWLAWIALWLVEQRW